MKRLHRTTKSVKHTRRRIRSKLFSNTRDNTIEFNYTIGLNTLINKFKRMSKRLRRKHDEVVEQPKETNTMGTKKVDFDYEQIRGMIIMAIKMFGLEDDIQAWLISMSKKAKDLIPDVENDIAEKLANANVRAILEELDIEPK